MDSPYQDVVVVELGARVAAGACGRLLADLGASVHVIEPPSCGDDWKWADRVGALAGKHAVIPGGGSPAAMDAVAALIGRAQVVIRSPDVDGPLPARWADALARVPIVCEITACGASGPLAGLPYTDADVQALTGVVATTGLPDGPATFTPVPVLEMSAALYAASSIALALHVLRHGGGGQRIEVALFDVGINTLTTFMPAHFAGSAPRRLGNGHAMAVPWNAYPAEDGWVLICSTNDAQWSRIAALVGLELSGDPRFARIADRLVHRDDIDTRLAAWTRRMPVEDVVAQLGAAGIPCGSIVPLDSLRGEPNVRLRASIAEVQDPKSGRRVQVPAAFIRFDGEVPPPPTIPAAGAAAPPATPPGAAEPPAKGGAPLARPLAGVRVIEIGQLTTAPLAARHLASFGADVIKVEPPGGESARYWAPLRGGTSHFFVATNGEKRSVVLDLRSAEGLAALKRLVADADVLVENMKPGALAAMGLSPDALQRINPRLVYCAISGFGLHSAYPGRAAVDTVIQAMSGIMDATRSGGAPVKAGISIADIAGGQSGLLAIVAALARREGTGRGSVIDLSMQDVGLWMTQGAWNGAAAPRPPTVDVNSVADACTHPHTAARELIVSRPDPAGRSWEVFASPMRLEKTPAQTDVLIGEPQTGDIDWRPVPSATPPATPSEQ